jgi:hypothetical protein
MQQGGYNYSQNNVQSSEVIQVKSNPMMQDQVYQSNQMNYPNQQMNYSNQQMNYPNQQMNYPNQQMIYNQQMNYPNQQMNYPNQQINYPINNQMPNQLLTGQLHTVMVVHNQLPIPDPLSVKLSSVTLYCGKCNTTVNSRVETQCSCANLCCYCWFSPVIWICFQCCRNKEISCNNATHYCPNCATPIGQYEAC